MSIITLLDDVASGGCKNIAKTCAEEWNRRDLMDKPDRVGDIVMNKLAIWEELEGA